MAKILTLPGLDWVDAQVCAGVGDYGGMVVGPSATDAEVEALAVRLIKWAIEDGLSPQWTEAEVAARIRSRLALAEG